MADLGQCPDCHKTTYPTPKAATAGARQARRGDDVRGKRRLPMSWYRCPSGNGYHLTSQKRRDHPEVTKKRGQNRRGR